MKILITESQLNRILAENVEKSEYTTEFIYDTDEVEWHMPDGASTEIIMITSEDGDIESPNRNEFILYVDFTTGGYDRDAGHGRYIDDLGWVENWYIDKIVQLYPEEKELDEMFIDMFTNDKYIYREISDILDEIYSHHKNGKWTDEHITETTKKKNNGK